MGDKTNDPVAVDPVRELGEALAKVYELTRDPQLQTVLGHRLLLELRYPITSYRQRFPDLWPSAQTTLF